MPSAQQPDLLTGDPFQTGQDSTLTSSKVVNVFVSSHTKMERHRGLLKFLANEAAFEKDFLMFAKSDWTLLHKQIFAHSDMRQAASQTFQTVRSINLGTDLILGRNGPENFGTE